MRNNLFLSTALLLTAGGMAVVQAQQDEQRAGNLETIRQVAAMIPGARPLRINVLKFAESRRTKNFSVKGAPKDPSIQVRTAFQLVDRDRPETVDSGSDVQVHQFLRRGREYPYFREQLQPVE